MVNPPKTVVANPWNKKTSSRFNQGNLPKKLPVQFRFQQKMHMAYVFFPEISWSKISPRYCTRKIAPDPSTNSFSLGISFFHGGFAEVFKAPSQGKIIETWTKPAETPRFLGGRKSPTAQHHGPARRRATFSLWTFGCCRTQCRGCQRCLAANVAKESTGGEKLKYREPPLDVPSRRVIFWVVVVS